MTTDPVARWDDQANRWVGIGPHAGDDFSNWAPLPRRGAQMTADPTTTLDKLLHALGAIQAAHGCLLGSTVANAGIIADYLGDAAVTIKGIIKEMP